MVDGSERVLVGRYRLDALLGRGGMGAVWRAHDQFLDRQVAIKEVLLPAGFDEDDAGRLYERLLREARAAARLDHHAIVHVHDVIIENGRPWIVMQLVRGRSLDQTVRQDGPLPPERVARIGLDLLDALRAAHAHGILHRDVTPRNVLLGDDGRAKLTDFGIAAIAGATQLTRTGALIGSPGYMAPERLGQGPVGPESDLWSLGATLYTAVEGRPAYQAGEVVALIAAVLSQDPTPPLRAGPLTPVLAGLLAKEPAERLAADQAARSLEVVVARAPVGAVGTVQRAVPATRQITDPVGGRHTPRPPVRPTAAEDLQIRALPGRVFLSGLPLYGVVAVIISAVIAGISQHGPSPFGILVIAVLVFGVARRVITATNPRFVLRAKGLTLHAGARSASIPAEVISAAGIVRGRLFSYLAVAYDSSAVLTAGSALAPFVAKGQRITGADGVVALLPARYLSREQVADIRRYVESTGITSWRERLR